MYDILGKLNSLAPKQEEAKQSKPLYESVEAKGSIVAGVKSVEQKLREQFEAMKEYDAKGTYKHKGNYGNEYNGDDAPAKPKHVPRTGVKGRKPKDRSAEAPFSTNKSHDPFGRTSPEAHKGAKGKRVVGKSTQDDNEIDESSDVGTWIDMSNLFDDHDHYELQNMGFMFGDNPESDVGILNGYLSKKGTDAHVLAVKGDKVKVIGGEHEVAETTNPYAIGMAQAKKEVGLGRAKTHVSKKVEKKAHRIGDAIAAQTNESKRSFLTKLSEGINFTEMMKERDRSLSELLSELQADIKAFKESGHCSDFLRDCLEVHGFGKRQLQDSMHPTRGPSFASQHPGAPAPVQKPSFLDKAKAFGQKALDVVAPGDDELISRLERETGGKRPNHYNEDAELNELAKLAGLQVSEEKSPKADKDYDGDGEVESEKDEVIGSRRKAAGLDESFSECMSAIGNGAAEMQQQQGRLSVNTSADSEGHKTVTITADGEEAEKLSQLLSLAGLGQNKAQAQPEQAAVVVAQEAKDYGDTDVEEAPEVLNTPRPDVQGMHRSPTSGFVKDTDDLNKPKSQHPETAAKGDNPLTKKEKAVEDFNPIDQLGAQLMAEYQSIKLQK